jgi:hypothetical protein
LSSEAIACPNCGASDVPLKFTQDFVPCCYCGSTIRVTDRRPNTTQATRERIEQERAGQGPAQDEKEMRTLRDLLNLMNKAKRGALWVAALAAAITLTVCAFSLLMAWLRQGEGESLRSLYAAAGLAVAALLAWLLERRAYRRLRRIPSIFR